MLLIILSTGIARISATEVAQKFAELRQSGINIEIDIFQRALSNYVLMMV